MENLLRFEVPNAVSIFEGRNGLPFVHLSHPDRSTAEIYLYGAHITSWTSPEGAELFFLSRKAVFEPGKPIRGGIPVIFPQFGPGDLPAHGIARIAPWELIHTGIRESGEPEARLRLSDTPETRAIWLRQFEMELGVTLGSRSLSANVKILNKDPHSFSFKFALHTYFRVADIRCTAINGLQGIRYADSLRNNAVETEVRDAIRFDQETDRIYLDAPDSVSIRDEANNRSFEVTKENMPDIVVWNPWIEKSKRLADFGDEEYPEMVCVETGIIHSASELAAGGEYAGKTTFYIK